MRLDPGPGSPDSGQTVRWASASPGEDRRRAGALLRCMGWLALCLALRPAPGRAQTPTPAGEAQSLARVEVSGPVESFPLPAHALLRDATGRDYLLVFASSNALAQVGWSFQAIDPAAGAPADYLLVREMRPGARAAAAAAGFRVLHDDGAQWVVRASQGEADRLAELGFALQRLGPQALVWTQPPRRPGKDGDPPFNAPPGPLVRAMIGQVQTTNLHRLMRRLTGGEPTLAAGEPVLVNTRHTASGPPVRNALQSVLDRLTQLGLDVQTHDWAMSGLTNRNVVATQPGMIRSNEFVLITAHLDDAPAGALAPGADDNASGVAAVLTAASVFSQYHFDRSVRFVLFTGEEQGLYGSAAYAAAAKAAGDNIVAVLNADMIAWDSYGKPTLKLYTRAKTMPGYTNDFVIAATFTNVVAACGLSSNLAPVLVSDGMGYSDHASFWNRGYPAICMIEDYQGDFNAYYHTTGDTMAKLNWPYFTAAVRATVATLGQLALPVEAAPAEIIEVAAGHWAPGAGIGTGVFLARGAPADAWAGPDGLDVAWSKVPAPTQPAWLQVFSEPFDARLQTDARPVTQETTYALGWTAGTTNTSGFGCSNRVRFDFLTPPLADRIYLARVHVGPAFTADGSDFLGATNLRTLVTQGGFWVGPNLANLADGVVYGSGELAIRNLDTNGMDCRVILIHDRGGAFTLSTLAQVGTRIVDTVEASLGLASNASWQRLATITNAILPDANAFDCGWKELRYPLDATGFSGSLPGYVRLRRAWLDP